MSCLPVGFGAAEDVDVGDIIKSLRFRGAAGAYLSRTFGTPTDGKKYTYSAWVKRSTNTGTGTNGIILLCAQAGTIEYIQIGPAGSVSGTGDVLSWRLGNASGPELRSTALYRDPSAWYHVVVAYDSTQATASDRVKLYVNGSQVTALTTASYPSLNATSDINSNGSAVRINSYTASYVGDGYLSRICFVDGQALTPSSFGYLNTEINEWVSKTKAQIRSGVGSFGTNGFMLNFENGTSLTTLGYDTKGSDSDTSGNNWALNNHSITAGVTYDVMDDHPGDSFCTFTPLRVLSTAGYNSTISNAGLTVSDATSNPTVRAVGFPFPASGNWWVEVTQTAVAAAASNIVGLLTEAQFLTLSSLINTGNYRSDGTIVNLAGVSQTSGSTYTTNDVIGVHVNADSGQVQFYKQTGGTGSFVAQGAAPSYTFTAGQPLWLHVATDNVAGTKTFNLNAGQRTFNNSSLPTGAKALCQQNLPTPAILNPKKHFDVVTVTNTAYPSDLVLPAVSFTPDLVWAKTRNQAYWHALYDLVRGVGNRLSSNVTDAESYSATALKSFSPVTYGTGDNSNFTASTTSVHWLFKAGGAGVTNTAGSITSTVSANVEAGFSIVTATPPASGAFTVGHGLGTAPKLIIVKDRQTGAGTGWPVFHSSVTTQNEYLLLNTTAAKATLSGMFGTNLPTSLVFGQTVGAGVNASIPFVAYCFADSSIIKCGSYTGNGSSDGVYVHVGFKIRWLLVKASTASPAGGWILYDTARDTYNQATKDLRADLANAEPVSSGPFDILSNGFKLRGTDTNSNGGSNTYIYIAIADVTGKFSNAR